MTNEFTGSIRRPARGGDQPLRAGTPWLAYRRHAGAVVWAGQASPSDAAWPRRSCRRCSCASGNAPDRFRPGRGTPRSYLLAQCHGRSVDLLRAETARRRREGARRASHRRGRGTTSSARSGTSPSPTTCRPPSLAPGGRAGRHPASRLPRRPHLPGGGRHPRRAPEGTGEEPDPGGLKRLRVELAAVGVAAGTRGGAAVITRHDDPPTCSGPTPRHRRPRRGRRDRSPPGADLCRVRPGGRRSPRGGVAPRAQRGERLEGMWGSHRRRAVPAASRRAGSAPSRTPSRRAGSGDRHRSRRPAIWSFRAGQGVRRRAERGGLLRWWRSP